MEKNGEKGGKYRMILWKKEKQNGNQMKANEWSKV